MFKQKKLSNGINLISIPMAGTKTATILVMIGTGSKYENKQNNGISHFLEHMFFKGTKKRPNTQIISGELDGVGAEYNAFTAKEYTGYWVKIDSAKMNLAADIVSDMFLNSKFDSAEIEREKGTIVEELNMYQDNPMMHIEDVFESCLYGDAPAGWDVIGTKKNILSFKRKDFLDYFHSQYGVGSTTVCLAGNIKAETEKLIERFFAGLKDSEFKDKISVKENQCKPQVKVHYKKTDQAALSLGVRAFPVGHKDEFALKLLSVLLGGSMSSRMFTEVRERRGLAYHIHTSAEFYTDSGYLTTQAGVSIAKIEEVIKVILKEYKKLTKVLVSPKELQRTKDLIKGRSVIQLEASDNMANWFARQAILRDQILAPIDYFKKIDKVSAMDIRRVSREIFQNKCLNLAVIGPFKVQGKFEKILNF